jgi:hypothetical protein
MNDDTTAESTSYSEQVTTAAGTAVRLRTDIMKNGNRLICAYRPARYGSTQVAAVMEYDDVMREMTGEQTGWTLVSQLATAHSPGLVARSEKAARYWLLFLCDLAAGVYTETGDK